MNGRNKSEAKGELQERIEESKLGGRIISFETVDKMTARQIAAKVRKCFLNLDLPMGSN